MGNAIKCSDFLKQSGKSVVLVGMMGTGKSHLGRRLAESLRLTFRDSDRMIEHQAGCAIAEIFERFGEEKFRQAEKAAIVSLLEGLPCVIATGGGAAANPEILAAIKSKGVSIWIDADIESIVKRLKNAKDRPLLQTGDPAETLRALMEERKPYYSQADIKIESVEGSVDETLQTMVNALYDFLKPDIV